MNSFLRIGRVFSRNCLLCFGGVMTLIALVGVGIGLVDFVRYGDWPNSTAKDFLPTAAVLAIPGTLYLLAAYGLGKSKRWGPAVAVAVCASQLAWMMLSWSRETTGLKGIVVILLLYDGPLLLVLLWALAEITQRGRSVKTA